MAKTIRWGILATGGIADTFTRDLLVDPKTRGVSHIVHSVTAAASSTSAARAQDFLRQVGAPSSAKGYGSYQELAADPDVDIIYIATPHSHHYQNAMLCLEGGKHVLCEKAFTVNAAQARALAAKAQAKGLFLMEAVWTRYFPLSVYVREAITSGALGNVLRVTADNSVNNDPEKRFGPDGNKSRMVNVDLAGGSLLDLGIYSLTWVFQTLYHTQPAATRKPPTVVSALTPYAPTGADEHTSMLLTFERAEGGPAHGFATTSQRLMNDPDGKGTAGPGVRIQGTQGELQVYPPLWRPTKTKLIKMDGTVEEKTWPQPGPGKGSGYHSGFGDRQNPEGEGQGMFWEADEAASALVEGRKEGKYEGLEESIVIMEAMDEVRRQHGMKYPEKIETTDYPVAL